MNVHFRTKQEADAHFAAELQFTNAFTRAIFAWMTAHPHTPMPKATLDRIESDTRMLCALYHDVNMPATINAAAARVAATR